VKARLALLIFLGACAGSDAEKGPEPTPAVDAGTGITTDTSWVPGSDSIASRVITVDGGTITLPRAFTVEIEPATLTDTQTVFVSVAGSPVSNPPWTGRVAFARTCPPKPVHLTAVLPLALIETYAPKLAVPAVALNRNFTPLSDYTRAADGRTLKFTVSERAFTRTGSGEQPCQALFTLPQGD
jgi:hypothetical protein